MCKVELACLALIKLGQCTHTNKHTPTEINTHTRKLLKTTVKLQAILRTAVCFERSKRTGRSSNTKQTNKPLPRCCRRSGAVCEGERETERSSTHAVQTSFLEWSKFAKQRAHAREREWAIPAHESKKITRNCNNKSYKLDYVCRRARAQAFVRMCLATCQSIRQFDFVLVRPAATKLTLRSI